MKKITALLLVLLLAFALCACDGGVKDPEPAPSPSPTPSPSPDPDPVADPGPSVYELWDKLEGVWISTENQYDFADFSTEGPDVGFAEGIFFSDGVQGGTVSDLAYKDGVYTFKLNVPALEPNDLNDGWPAFSVDIQLELTDDPKVIKLTNFFTGNSKVTEYRRLADSWDDIDMDEIMYGPKVPLADVWNKFAGVWLAAEKNGMNTDVFFVNFLESDGSYQYYTGIPFSGYGLSTEPEYARYNEKEDYYVLRMEANGEMQDVFIYPDGFNSDPKTIRMETVAGNGTQATWKYVAESMDDLTVEMMMEMDD